MRGSKAQAQENRARIVERAAALFRERGYDGVSVAELMAAAGFTHGGFYKHFGSKADLMAEATARGFLHTVAQIVGVGVVEFVKRYVARDQRDARSDVCTLAALCGDAARQPAAIKATFATGIESMLSALEWEGVASSDVDQHKVRAKMINMLAHALGAIVLSRACPDDSPLVDEILEVCRTEILVPLHRPPGAPDAEG